MAASTAHGAAQAVGGHEGAAGPAAWAWVLLPLIPVAMALLGAPVRASLGIGEERRASFCNWWAVAACSATLRCWSRCGPVAPSWAQPESPEWRGWGLQFSITPASLLFSLFSTWLWLLASLFSRSYLSRGHGHARYYFYFLLCLGGTLGTFLAANLLTLFVFFEIVSLGGISAGSARGNRRSPRLGGGFTSISASSAACVCFSARCCYTNTSSSRAPSCSPASGSRPALCRCTSGFRGPIRSLRLPPARFCLG